MTEKQHNHDEGQPIPESKPDTPKDFLLHVGVLVFVACYFGALLFWFGRLFVTGGAEEHVVMSMVIPAVMLVGLVGIVCLSIVIFEGRREAMKQSTSSSSNQ